MRGLCTGGDAVSTACKVCRVGKNTCLQCTKKHAQMQPKNLNIAVRYHCYCYVLSL